MTRPTGPGLILSDPTLRLIALAIICIGTVAAALAPYQSMIAVQIFAIPPRFYTAILVTAALISVSSSVVVGILTDQHAIRRLTAILSTALLVTGYSLVRLAPSALTFTLAHAIIAPLAGSLFGQLFALTRIVTRDRPEEERDRIAALIRAAFALPFIVILPLWSLAIAAGVSLLNVYSLALAAALIGLTLILRDWPQDAQLPPHPRSGPSFRAAMAELAHPALMARMVALGLAASSISLYMVLLGLTLTTTAHRPQSEVALFAGLTAGLEIPVMLLTTPLLRRLKKTKVIALGAALHAAFMVLLSQSAHLPAILPLAAIAAMGAGILLTIPLGYMQDLLHHRPGAGGALIAVNQFLVAAFAALAFLIGTQISGYSLAALIGAAFAVTGAGLLLWLDRAG
jgi:MFS transporter, SET family, sugar efflux transporter